MSEKYDVMDNERFMAYIKGIVDNTQADSDGLKKVIVGGWMKSQYC